MKHWYYLDDRQQKIGPLSDAQLDVLFHQGKITGETLVWNQEMSDWQPLKKASGYTYADNSDRATGEIIALHYIGAIVMIGVACFMYALQNKSGSGLTGGGWAIVIGVGLLGVFLFDKAERLRKHKKHVEDLLRDGRQ